MTAEQEIARLNLKVAELRHAIGEANEWLRVGEGVNLLYYASDCGETGSDAYNTIADVIGED